MQPATEIIDMHSLPPLLAHGHVPLARAALLSHCNHLANAQSAMLEALAIGKQLCKRDKVRRPLDLHCVQPQQMIHLLQDVPGRAFAAPLRSGAHLLYVPVPKAASYMLRMVLASKACSSGTSSLPAMSQELQAGYDTASNAVGLDVLQAGRHGVLSFVRDPVERFVSAFYEMETYEEQGAMREWGRTVLSQLGVSMKLRNQSSNAMQQGRLMDAVHSLACFGDWQPHYTAQASFLPNSSSIMLLSDLSMLGTLSATLAPFLAKSACTRKLNGMLHDTKIAHERPHPHAHELLSSMGRQERRIWCLYYLPDYVRFRWYTPPSWCTKVWDEFGFSHLARPQSQRPVHVNWALLAQHLNKSIAELQKSSGWSELLK
mmetsp:Transcript_6522/g.16865  ORF Transcript_6522/g.16865 Transcript_6522/m.16865 type:complete len:374 (-) Transcript_6522:93-1214(-)|eukprot:CAMPEP_0115863470 /NCGR_PEP_ID=MMETSP0287-20121206/18705_1 /TAXON_ID=412157 /ORGANISM="Chrysochromulina rotalis, Strain UIO044" /LENGTH=373 /DNA_ID=CAMNT_0003317917 /DNA_START=114 /DNA_END=1235 /DNA_ORIENTATION=+